MTLTLTRITSTSCDLAKRYTLGEDGRPVSSAVAHMMAGRADVTTIADLTDLRAVLDALAPNQAITLGVPTAGSTELTTRAGAEYNPQAVARTNENFRYLDTPALFPIDVDTTAGVYQTVGEILDALEASSPWLRHVTRVARPSASSFVGGAGLRGVHVYIAITRGTDTPELAQRVQVEQWAAGRGSVVISRSGALLTRQLSDALVYQPSRLMFEAPPVLCDGVTRVVPDGCDWLVRKPDVMGRPARYRTDAGLLDVQELPKLRDIELRRFETAVRKAKDAKRVEAKRVALDYHKANALAAGREDGELLGVLALRALGDQELPPNWPVVFERDGSLLRGTVADALAAWDSIAGRRCADPFDSTRHDLKSGDLRAGELVTMQGRPGIWSHKLGAFFAFCEADARVPDHPLELAAERLCGTIESWPDRADKKRSSAANLSFVVRLLCRDGGITLAHDVCTDAPVSDENTPTVAQWLDAVTRVGCSGVSIGTLESVIETVSKTRPVDPWKDSILSLPLWDGRARLDSLFTDLFGAPGSEALTGATQVMFAGLVMRQLRPGAPCPVVPVLIGDQGVDKSLFLIRLADAMGWPAPTPVAFAADERKMSMAAARSPVAELAEMSGLSKRDSEDIKRWTTDTQDVYRAPYGRREESHPRRFVLLGTANKHELNRDETGNRRFMPVMCQHAAPVDWAAEVQQLLAEAKHRFCQSWDDYVKLIRTVPDAVRSYNDEAMRQGMGTVKSDLDDLLPPILSRLLLAGPTVRSADIRAALDALHSGRKYDARAIASWLRMRGWAQCTDSRGMRTYRAPADWQTDDLSPVGTDDAAARVFDQLARPATH